MSADRFLSLYESPHTVKTYRLAMKWFLEEAYGSGDLSLFDRYLEEARGGKRDQKEDILKFYTSMKEKAPMTVGVRLAAVRTFLLENEIELSSQFWKRLRGRKRSRAVTYDQPPTPEELKLAVNFMPVQHADPVAAGSHPDISKPEPVTVIAEDLQGFLRRLLLLIPDVGYQVIQNCHGWHTEEARARESLHGRYEHPPQPKLQLYWPKRHGKPDCGAVRSGDYDPLPLTGHLPDRYKWTRFIALERRLLSLL